MSESAEGTTAVFVFVIVQTVVVPARTEMAAGTPAEQMKLVCVHPAEAVSVRLKFVPTVSPVKVCVAVPPTVVNELRPKLLEKVNVPSPPTEFLITLIDPVAGAAAEITIEHFGSGNVMGPRTTLTAWARTLI